MEESQSLYDFNQNAILNNGPTSLITLYVLAN